MIEPDAGDGRAGRGIRLVVNEGHAVAALLADRWWTRTRGLLFRPTLTQGEGLLRSPGKIVHTCLMRRPIDIVYLDGELRIVKTATSVRPWRFSCCRRGARFALQLADGEVERLGMAPGMRLAVHPAQELG